MSLTLDGGGSAAARGRAVLGPRALIAVGALALSVAVLVLLDQVLAPATPAPAQRSPFGVGVREAAPAWGGLFGQLMIWQSQFFRGLTQAARSALAEPAAAWALISGSFLYGLVHAAGPGHGKAVISAYIVADAHALRRGVALSVAAALVQALSAILLVGIAALALNATARQVDGATRMIETAAFAAIAFAGLFVLWRKAGQLARLASGDAATACAEGCERLHMPAPPQVSGRGTLGEMAMVALAAGIRPCTGAIVVLTFCTVNGFFLVGVASALAMAAGVALATSALAALAVGFKALALGLAGGRGLSGTRALLMLECLAAALVAALGLTLVAGLVALPPGA